MDAGVRPIAPVAVHRFLKGEPWEGTWKLDPGAVEATSTSDVFEYLEDIVDSDEGHLEIDLGELQLTIRSLIFVAKTAGDLEVAFEAGNHQQLFHQLRRLGQRIELAFLEACRDQKISRAFGGRLGEDRGFDFGEVVIAKGFTDRATQTVTQGQISL